jgi:putative ATPase
VRVIEIKQHSLNALMKILTQACQKLNITVDNSETLLLLAKHSSGDARFALGLLEESLEDNSIVLKKVLEVLKSSQRTVRDFDKQGDRHFDTISAFIKAMRGSDPQSALLWLAVMIEGGMDPLFIARRLIIFSSEDIGNADPQALVLSTSSLEALKHIGMPEGRIILSQVVTYLSCALKSNASYVAINEAQKYIEKNQTLKVPNHLKNHPPLESSHYLYPHDYPNNFVKQKYHQEDFPLNFYRPSEMGCEKKLKEWNEIRWGKLKE